MQKRANRITFRNHWYVQVFDQTINEHIRFILTGTGMNYINSSRRVYLNTEKKVYEIPLVLFNLGGTFTPFIFILLIKEFEIDLEV